MRPIRFRSALLVGISLIGMLLEPPRVALAAPTCHGHRATIVGTGGRDRLRGRPKRDVIVAFGGSDRIWGGGGNDIICAGLGADVEGAATG